MKEKFESRRLTGKVKVACKYDDGTVRYWDTRKEDIIANVSAICREYQAMGYTLTLRQIHYRLVAKNQIINHLSCYKKLGVILDDCRYSGVVDWSAVEDRGRVPNIPYSVEDVEDALSDALNTYRIDRQRNQDVTVELWSEKDALSGILKKTTHKYHVRLVVNKGYSSSSAMYNAYHRYLDAIAEKKKVIILYFGDHDPSGLDMIRDIEDRLVNFLSKGYFLYARNEDEIDQHFDENEYGIFDSMTIEEGEQFEKMSESEQWDYEKYIKTKTWLRDKGFFKVVPIGLTMEQIKKYRLPENPAKMTDSRSPKYVNEFGAKCWEVDALEPHVLTEIVETNIQEYIDNERYIEMIEQEDKDKAKLKLIIENIPDDTEEDEDE